MVTCGFFNSVYGDRKYDADQMSDFYTGIVTQGVFQHVDNGLAVTAGTGLTVSVNTGRAIIQNKWVKNDTPLILELAPAPTTYGRFDRVVLKYDSNSRNVQIIVKTGTPAGTPGVPELVREGGIYEMCLAEIDVEAGATSVTVTDTRSDPNLCGWATVAQATSGEVDQMLNDLKIGFDGSVYSTPAAEVQGSDTKLNNAILYQKNELIQSKYVNILAESGAFSDADGSKVTNNTRIRNVVPVPVKDLVSITFPDGYYVWIYKFNAKFELIGAAGWFEGKMLIDNLYINGMEYINISFRNKLTPSADISSQVSTVQSGTILEYKTNCRSVTNALDYDFSVDDENGNSIMSIRDGHIYTEKFDSKRFEDYLGAPVDESFAGYDGERITFERNMCKGQEYLTMTAANNPQGGAVFGDYYFQFSDYRAACYIYNLKTKALVQTYQFESSSTLHCNNVNFGNERYLEDDQFPLLYVSQEHATVHNVQVYRITGSVGAFSFTLVQTITWDAPADCHVYYPNAIIDKESSMIYQVGYTTNSYEASPGNKIVLNKFPLPLLSAGNVTLHDSDKLDTFELPSVQATQGAFVDNGKIYQAYGSHSAGPRSIRVIDLLRKCFVTIIDLAKSPISSVLSTELETVFLYNGNLYTVGYNKKVYKLEFSIGM